MKAAIETGRREDGFWREYPKMVEYFSPGIVPLLKYLDLSTKDVMRSFGELVGKSAASRMAGLSLNATLDELTSVWEKQGIGTLNVDSTEPLVLQISNCAVCGQLQGTGDMFECAFHEGFFQGILSAKAGRPVSVSQETNFEGEAGTWCRRLVTDIAV
jgi:predicted hydrocarbon binding protein